MRSVQPRLYLAHAVEIWGRKKYELDCLVKSHKAVEDVQDLSWPQVQGSTIQDGEVTREGDPLGSKNHPRGCIPHPGFKKP